MANFFYQVSYDVYLKPFSALMMTKVSYKS